MKKAIAAAALTLLATPALAARDHLVPEASVYAAGPRFYAEPRLNPKLLPLFEPHYVARLIGDVATLGQTGFGLRQENGRSTIRIVELFTLRHPDTDCEAPLDDAFAADLVTAWRKVVGATRFADGVQIGLDGTTHHFAVRNALDHPHDLPGGPYYGQVWSPDEGSPPQILVAIVQGLTKYCTTRDAALLLPLRAQAAALVHRLEKGD